MIDPREKCGTNRKRRCKGRLSQENKGKSWRIIREKVMRKKDEKYADDKMSYEFTPEENRWHAKACKLQDGECRGRWRDMGEK